MVFYMRLKLLEAKIAKIANIEQFLGQNPSQSEPKCQGGGGITAYMVSPHAANGTPTVGAARIGRGAVLEGSVAT
jgi:hypothetical protein